MTIQSGGRYKFINEKSHTAIDLSGSDNVSILGWESHEGDNQKWTLERVGEHWTIRNVRSGSYLGVDGTPNNGVGLKAIDHPVQWDIRPDAEDNSAYRIYVAGQSRPINIDLSDHGNPSNGTPVVVWDKWQGKNQVWRLEQV